MGQNPFRRGQVDQYSVGGVEVGVAYNDLGVVGRPRSSKTPSPCLRRARFAWRGCCTGCRRPWTGPAPPRVRGSSACPFGKEGSDAVFEVRDDVQHGGRAVRIAAVVRRVSVEELHQLGVRPAGCFDGASQSREADGPAAANARPDWGGALVEAGTSRQVKRSDARAACHTPPVDVVGMLNHGRARLPRSPPGR